MGADSKIQWTDHTFNPWWGCAHVSPGCLNCYAEDLAARYGFDAWGARGHRRMLGDGNWRDPEKWDRKAAAAGERARVFCASMADVFEDRPDLDAPRARLWDLIERTGWLDWMLLTKRPENIARMIPWGDNWPSNVWAGTSVEDQRRADERLPVLRAVPATRFLSVEPLLGPVALDPEGIDWVIVGGESGPGARPMDLEWARAVRDTCQRADVPVFVKQLGTVWARDNHISDHKGGEPAQWPGDLRVREMLPRCPRPAAQRQAQGGQLVIGGVAS
jgi:protein gp37